MPLGFFLSIYFFRITLKRYVVVMQPYTFSLEMDLKLRSFEAYELKRYL